MDTRAAWRKTEQLLLPTVHAPPPRGQYDRYPGFPIGANKIGVGYTALAERLIGHARIVIDGYVGIFWKDFRARLDDALACHGVRARWLDIAQALKPAATIEALVEPFLGGDDPLFGTRFTGELADFFDSTRLRALQPDATATISIVYGCGAALCGWDAFLVYVDLPKNELQFRSRAGTVCNLGTREPVAAKAMYKRFYFVDWVVLNHHKASLLPRIDLIVDGQRPDEPALMSGDDVRDGLTDMSRNYFRVRPWFEPGPWGGQWIKRMIGGLPQDVHNYAWSFELIVPENGLLLESSSHLLEISFDFLMFHDRDAVLGAGASRFGFEFPIRFDLLDTFGGGNLSLQCHPRPEFIRAHFGERFTQDETYYILDCTPDARVYLGFRDDIDPGAFRTELERSVREGVEIDVARFVNVQRARKHDLFLIPSGTIHCSGKDNLVLEISATPYIFTFKLYDWMRLDLEGRPRPLNLDRAFRNLRFDRKGERVRAELISNPSVLQAGRDWRLVHLPTHPEHFYDVHRFEFEHSVEASTAGSPHVMSLVEGESVILETAGGLRQRFNYAETFVVPAAAGRYRFINEGHGEVKVVKAFLKTDRC